MWSLCRSPGMLNIFWLSRSAAELDELFERKIKPWRFHKTETATQRLAQIRRERDSWASHCRRYVGYLFSVRADLAVLTGICVSKIGLSFYFYFCRTNLLVGVIADRAFFGLSIMSRANACILFISDQTCRIVSPIRFPIRQRSALTPGFQFSRPTSSSKLKLHVEWFWLPWLPWLGLKQQYCLPYSYHCCSLPMEQQYHHRRPAMRTRVLTQPGWPTVSSLADKPSCLQEQHQKRQPFFRSVFFKTQFYN